MTRSLTTRPFFPRRALPVACALTLLCLGTAAQAQHFTFDTSALSGQAGFLDFQFSSNTGGTTPLDSTLTLSGFAGGTLGAVDAASTFNVTPALPSGDTLSNAGGGGELRQAFTFGSSLSFDAAFPAPAGAGAADEGNTFQFFVLDGGANPFQTTDASGANTLAAMDQSATGAVSPARVFALSAPTPVPEASPALSLGLLLLGGAFLAVRRRKAA